MKLYWNYAVGGVELEAADNNCPIVKSPHDDGIVIESWWTDSTHRYAINFAHLRNGFYDRDMFFKRNNVNPQEMRWLMIPESEYKQLEEREEHYRRYGECMSDTVNKDPNNLSFMFDGVTAFKGWTTKEMLEQIRKENNDNPEDTCCDHND